jgi:hypothetical protein
MFRNTVFRATAPIDIESNARLLFNSSPAQILTLLDHSWKNRGTSGKAGVLKQAWETDPMPLMANPNGYLGSFIPTIGATTPLLYPHVIEAFCLESTRIVEIFRQVVDEFLHGEQLAVPPDGSIVSPSTDIVAWLRTTETVFFSPPPLLASYNVQSGLRDNGDLIRRNLYFRMLGADLLHPAQGPFRVGEAANDDKGTQKQRPSASNRDFFSTFERLLAEVWRGVVNATNTSGRRDTDDAAIATMTTRLHDPLRDRRLGGNLQREEFYATAMLSWLHMAIAWNSPIVKALKAEADHPADRLARIAERVQKKAHVHSAAYIQMAPLASMVMEAIETGLLNDPLAAPFFYRTIGGSPFPELPDVMTQLITLYMRATGRDIKAAAVTVSQRA